MRTIHLDRETRLIVATRLLDPTEPWQPPRAILQLFTEEGGINLEFEDLSSLQLVASAARALLADSRLRMLPLSSFRPPRQRRPIGYPPPTPVTGRPRAVPFHDPF